MVPLGVPFSLLIESQGLVEVALSAILDPFDFSRFVLCPWAMPLFQKLCPIPFPPVTSSPGIVSDTRKYSREKNK